MTVRTKRLVLLTVINVLLLAILGILCIYVSVFVGPRIEAELNKHLKETLPAFIEYESLDVEYIAPEIVIRSVNLNDQLRVDKIHFQPELTDLVNGKINIRHLIISRPRTVFDGSTRQVTIRQFKDWIESLTRDLNHPYLPTRTIERVTIEDGELKWNRESNVQHTLDHVRIDVTPVKTGNWRDPLDVIAKAGTSDNESSAVYEGTMTLAEHAVKSNGRLRLNGVSPKPWLQSVPGISASPRGSINGHVAIRFQNKRLHLSKPVLHVSGLSAQPYLLQLNQFSQFLQRVEMSDAIFYLKNSTVDPVGDDTAFPVKVPAATVELPSVHLADHGPEITGSVKFKHVPLVDKIATPGSRIIRINSHNTSGTVPFEWKNDNLEIKETTIHSKQPRATVLASTGVSSPTIPGVVSSAGPININLLGPRLTYGENNVSVPTTQITINKVDFDSPPILLSGHVNLNRAPATILNAIPSERWTVNGGTLKGKSDFELRADQFELANSDLEFNNTRWSIGDGLHAVRWRPDHRIVPLTIPENVKLKSFELNVRQSVIDDHFQENAPPLLINELSVTGKSSRENNIRKQLNLRLNLGQPDVLGKLEASFFNPAGAANRIRLTGMLDSQSLPELNPYLKPAQFFPFHIHNGSMRLNADGTITQNNVDVETNLQLKDLRVSQSDSNKHTFLGKPIDFVRFYIHNNRGNLELTYDITGSPDDLAFKQY